MNYAFILLDDEGSNEADEYPLIVSMDPEDPQIDIKVEVFLDGSDHKWKEFKIKNNFEDNDDFEKLLSWMRFVTYDGDLYSLYDRIEKSHAEWLIEEKSKGKDIADKT